MSSLSYLQNQMSHGEGPGYVPFQGKWDYIPVISPGRDSFTPQGAYSIEKVHHITLNKIVFWEILVLIFLFCTFKILNSHCQDVVTCHFELNAKLVEAFY